MKEKERKWIKETGRQMNRDNNCSFPRLFGLIARVLAESVPGVTYWFKSVVIFATKRMYLL